MSTFIRLTDYKSSDDKEKGFFKSENRYEAKQEDFEKIPGSPIAYWVSDRVNEIYVKSTKLNEIAPVKKGMDTSNNDLFLKLWTETNFEQISFNTKSLDTLEKDLRSYVPYNKGGGVRKWYGNNEYLINWNDGDAIRSSRGTIRSPHLYFQDCFSWSEIGTGFFSIRFSDYSAIFDATGPSVISDDRYLLSILNSNTIYKLLLITTPTIHYNVGSVAELPIIFPKLESTKQKIETLTQQNIYISKEEWDSRETSWDFTCNELLKHKRDSKIETAFKSYCDYWREKFNTLHVNEEELNRLFIDIYELQDELTPDVELKDITILKQEADIKEGELVFNANEIMKQFISYGVGVMFGRYSLDSEGLVVANMGQEIPTDTSFEIDDDNIIPVLEDDYFVDDIASRFVQFVKVAFGEEHHAQNIRFIEDALGTTIRKYFVKGFYEDHIKRYKKRPIYWMVSSPKKSFNALIYMHRYEDDIFARVQNNYVREYITKLEAASHTATTIANDESNSAADRRKANKEIDTIAKKLDEIIKFDRDKLTPFAQSRTAIDLDDGVKVNYCKFKEILYPITGLCK